MLLAGETVLKNRLSDAGFLIFWLACFALTVGAIAVALLDARAVARGNLKEQRDLFEATLRNIASDAKTRSRPRTSKEHPGKSPSRNGD
jgi:hypothetical protein